MQRGETVGLLAGVPVGLKDIIYTAGLRTAAGSRVYANFVPAYDATVTARLKSVRAISLGKTVTTEFATADPSPTHNPWNTAHTPGGSSSGSAASVAARSWQPRWGHRLVARPCGRRPSSGLKPELRPHQPLWHPSELVPGPRRHPGAQRPGRRAGTAGYCRARRPPPGALSQPVAAETVPGGAAGGCAAASRGVARIFLCAG